MMRTGKRRRILNHTIICHIMGQRYEYPCCFCTHIATEKPYSCVALFEFCVIECTAVTAMNYSPHQVHGNYFPIE